MTFAAISTVAGERSSTEISARRGEQLAWKIDLAGSGGPLARTSRLLVATMTGVDRAAEVELRGAPGIVAVGIDPATSAVRWKRAIDSSEWAAISAIAPLGDDVVIGGSFSGTLRAGDRVVSSAGKSDGFVARLRGDGSVAWLVRTGGPGADGVQGVAATGDRIAIAGTFAGTGAELRGTPLVPFDERTLLGDGFVAELTGAGDVRWVSRFGGKADDTVTGVAIDGRGRVVVAANARDVVHVHGLDLLAQGPSDGLVAWWNPDGTPGPALLIGGSDFDGTRGIVAAGDRVVVACFFSGAVRIGATELTAGGGDDAALVALDHGNITEVWPITGEGREEIAALAPVTGGFIAGISHTARANAAGAELPAPKDPLSGAALLLRPVR
ncbi:MAG: hypothetical protein ACTHU0_16625 [Kofleriaceae bacterium]